MSKRIFVLGVVGLLACTYTLARFGPGPLLESRESARVVFKQGDEGGARYWAAEEGSGGNLQGVLYGRLTKVPTFVALYLLLYKRRNRESGVRPPSWEVPFIAVLVAANVLVNNPFANSRAAFGGHAIAIASIYFPLT